MLELLSFDGRPTWVNVAVFIVSAAVIWLAGTRMVRLVDRLAQRTGMGQGFAGMLLLGGIVSLTEISTVSTAAFTGTPLLALNNLLGSESINLFLLAAVDPLSGRDALTSFVAKPAMLMQATLVIVLLSVVAMAMILGDPDLFGVGGWSTALFLLCLGALWMSSRYQGRMVWVPSDRAEQRRGETAKTQSGGHNEGEQEPLWQIVAKLAGSASIIFVAGFSLSMTGDALAQQTGLGASIVGFALVLVLACHAKLPFAEGGFVGLDQSGGEDDLARRAGIQEPAHPLAGAFEGIGGQLAERVHAAVNIGMQLPLVMRHRLDHRGGHLHRGAIVQVRQRPAVDLLVEDRELRAQFGHVVAMRSMQPDDTHPRTSSSCCATALASASAVACSAAPRSTAGSMPASASSRKAHSSNARAVSVSSPRDSR